MSLTLWLTGLPSAGKTTLANAIGQRLSNAGLQFHILDGDAMREYLTNDLGFSKEDRDANVRRIGFVASLLSSHGVITICPVISPFREARNEVRSLHADGRFIEVYVATNVDVCEERDVKGLYAKARSGLITSMTGIDDPYEPPIDPEVIVEAGSLSVDECVETIWSSLMQHLSTTSG